MQKIIYFSEIASQGDALEKAVIDYIREGQIETYEGFSGYTLAAFDWYPFEDREAAPSQILIYIDPEDLYYICENQQAYDTARRCVSKEGSNEEALYGFFYNLMRGGIHYLETVDQEVADLEDDVHDGTEEGLSDRIIEMRNRIRHIHSYYEQMEFLLSEISDNRNGLISADRVRSFENLSNRAVRMRSMAAHLREYITQVREEYQAQIGIEQNNLMKVFTMVTSIFLPLTLIAGWYGMNLKMPEFNWDFGYGYVVVLSLLVCAVWLLVFRKKRWI